MVLTKHSLFNFKQKSSRKGGLDDQVTKQHRESIFSKSDTIVQADYIVEDQSDDRLV